MPLSRMMNLNPDGTPKRVVPVVIHNDAPVETVVTNKEPLPVTLDNDQKPLTVTLADGEKPIGVVYKPDPNNPLGTVPTTTTEEQDRQSAGVRLALRTAAPTTTEEQDRKTESQREINKIWEKTQRQIAMWVIGAALMSAVVLGLFGKFLTTDNSLQLAANVFLFGVANLVTGFYFGRTNHQRTGGIDGDDAGPR